MGGGGGDAKYYFILSNCTSDSVDFYDKRKSHIFASLLSELNSAMLNLFFRVGTIRPQALQTKGERSSSHLFFFRVRTSDAHDFESVDFVRSDLRLSKKVREKVQRCTLRSRHKKLVIFLTLELEERNKVIRKNLA